MKKRDRLLLMLPALGMVCLLGQLGFGAIEPSGTYLSHALINGTTVQRWNDSTQTLLILVEPGTGVSGWTPSKVQLVKSAFSEWQTALGGRLKFVYTPDLSQADVVVKWSARNAGTQVGHQSIRYANNILTDAFINVDMYNPQNKPMHDDEIRVTTLHEIGHLLGIRGHSPVRTDVMYADLQPDVRHLSARDIATAKALYRMKPTITNPLGVHLMAYKQFLYYKGLAINAFNQKDYAGAYKYFHQAQGYYSHEPTLYYCLGISAFNSRNYDQAIPSLVKATEVPDTNRNQATYFLASALTASASHDVMGGHKDMGRMKLEQAKQYYTHLVNDPATPVTLRQSASSQIGHINQVESDFH